jgi:hypothetical protein
MRLLNSKKTTKLIHLSMNLTLTMLKRKKEKEKRKEFFKKTKQTKK